jgi:hypothetical protein
VLVACAIVAAGIVPGLARDGTPQPARSLVPPPDFTAEGLTFEGDLGDGSILQKAFVSKPGQASGTFEWTPASTSLKIAVGCKSAAHPKTIVSISVGDVPLPTQTCGGDVTPTVSETIEGGSGLWAGVDVGRSTPVRVEVINPATYERLSDPNGVFGVGLYTSPQPEHDPMPTRTIPTVPEDYVRDGFRFRHRIGGDTLLEAKIGKPGENVMTVEFTPTSPEIRISQFCQGSNRYQVRMSLNGLEVSPSHLCGLEHLDNGLPKEEADRFDLAVKVGEPSTITLRLIDPTLEPGDGSARIGVGIYQLGPQRMIGPADNQVGVPEVTEHGGILYRLDEVRTADATKSGKVSISTPDGTPFLLGYGSTDTGPGKLVLELGGSGKGPMLIGMNGAGQAIHPDQPRAAGTASAVIHSESERPTKGLLYIAVYLPAK